MTSFGKITATVCVAILFNSFALQSQAKAADQPLFESDQLLNLRIEAPLTTLFTDLLNADEYVEGTLYFAGADGVEQSLPIKIKPRGKTRRDKKICRFPPLTINFKKKSTEGTVFQGQDKLKLVTHCQSKKSSYEQYYLQEHTIYKTYNIVTDQSFLARLAQVDYVDTEGKQSVSGKHAFFIEDAGLLGARISAERLKVETIPSANFDINAAARFAIFQYFIGNLDWAMLGGPPGDNCCHNSKAYLASSGQTIPIPYDFDYSGLINASYAVPPDSVRVKSVRQRAYRGFCKHNDGIEPALQLFRQNKESIYALAQNAPHLKEKTVNSMVKYYDAFYKIIEDPKKAQKAIYDRCR
jgi:hypothetical protein